MTQSKRVEISLLFLAVWFGMFTGIDEVCVATIRSKWWVHPDSPLSTNYFWMMPLADVIFFGIFGLLLTLFARKWPHFIPFRFAVFVYSFLGFISLLLMFSSIHMIAILILTTGLAMQTACLAAIRPRFFANLVHLTTAWAMIFDRCHWKTYRATTNNIVESDSRQVGTAAFCLGILTILGLLAVGPSIWRNVREKNTLHALPAAAPNAPNVLMIVFDTVRAESLSLYGYERSTTPNLEQWAAKGVVFDWAMAPAPWTLPSHASMFTGRWPYELSTDWMVPLDDTYPTLAEVLSAHGYSTAGFVANVAYCSFKHGLNRGFIHYEDYPVSFGQIVLSSSVGRMLSSNSILRNFIGYHEILNRKHGIDVSTHFLNWLSKQNRERPFFAFLNYFDAHEPFLPPTPYDTIFGPRRGRVEFDHVVQGAGRLSKWEMNPKDLQIELDAYEGAIAYLDLQLKIIFDRLKSEGIFDNTLVIITSDHGEHFGEHGFFNHANSLYQSVVHVPLVFLFPKHIPKGLSVSEPVSLRDLPATVIDLLGIREKTYLAGESLARFWKNQTDSRFYIKKNDMLLLHLKKEGVKRIAMVSGPYKYIFNKENKKGKTEELYNYIKDKSEENNIISNSRKNEILKIFETHIRNIDLIK